MEVYHNTNLVGKNISPRAIATAYPNINQEQINDLLKAVKEDLLASSIIVGLNVIKIIIEEKAIQYVGPKDKHDPDHKAYILRFFP